MLDGGHRQFAKRTMTTPSFVVCIRYHAYI
jgi:hypothetical protein